MTHVNLWNRHRILDIENGLVVAKWEGVGKGWSERLGLSIYRMDEQQGPAIYCRELYTISYDKP